MLYSADRAPKIPNALNGLTDITFHLGEWHRVRLHIYHIYITQVKKKLSFCYAERIHALNP